MQRLFGTDGIRGIPGEYPLTDEIIFKIGKACADFLSCQKGIINHQLKIVIGKDTRLSGEKIEKILAKSISSCGAKVILVGIIPTPGLSFLVRNLKADMGLMISASHNQAKDNGIKFFSNSGYKISKTYEEKIEELISGYLSDFDLPLHRSSYISQIEDGKKRYMDFLKSLIPKLDLKGFKIIVDCAYGAVSDIAPLVFKDLGADVISINDQPNGMNINSNCGALYPEDLAKLVTKQNADIGLSFDGDGDRIILSDEKGNVLDGDYIMSIIGLHLLKKNLLPKNTIVTTAMSNYGLKEAIEDAGGKIIYTDVGDRNVTEVLSKNNLNFGGEQSGHIIFLNHSPTPDALITCLEILKVMQETDKRLSELSNCMRKFPQVLINVRVKEKKPLEYIPQVQERISNYEFQLNGNGRLLVRYSGTEPVARIMVEGRDKNLIEDIAESIAGVIQDTLGVHN